MSLVKFSLISFFVLFTATNSFAEKIKVSVPEMVCSHCTQAVENRLKQEKDISKIEIDLKNKEVTIFTVDSVKISDEKVKSLIKDSGFEANIIAREG